MTTVDRIAQDLETAKTEYATGIAALKTPGGRAVYSPEEERRRRNELTASYQARQQAAQDSLQAAITDAENQITAATPRDALDKLVASEMEKALQLRSFVNDDFEHLQIAELVTICNDALASSDRARRAVTLRAGRHAMASRFNGPEGHELKQALADLAESFTDTAKRDAARASLEAAQKLQVSMATSAYIERTYGGQRRDRVA